MLLNKVVKQLALIQAAVSPNATLRCTINLVIHNNSQPGRNNYQS